MKLDDCLELPSPKLQHGPMQAELVARAAEAQIT